MEKEEKNLFISLFISAEEIYTPIPLIDAFGFYVNKQEDQLKENISSMTVYIRKEDLDSSVDKKSIHLGAIYGKPSENGVYFRNKPKITEPVDIYSDGEFYYQISDHKIFKGKKEISGTELLNKFYNLHIKSTKPIKGLLVRSKLLFWRTIIFSFFRGVTKLFYYTLYFLTGDRYTYETVFNQEILNGKVVFASLKDLIDKGTENVKESKKIDFLGYEVDYWSIVVYSIIHLLSYLLLFHFGKKPVIMYEIVSNNFLLLLYVIISLWFFEIVIPRMLKRLIKITSGLSFYVKYKRTIKI